LRGVALDVPARDFNSKARGLKHLGGGPRSGNARLVPVQQISTIQKEKDSGSELEKEGPAMKRPRWYYDLNYRSVGGNYRTKPKMGGHSGMFGVRGRAPVDGRTVGGNKNPAFLSRLTRNTPWAVNLRRNVKSTMKKFGKTMVRCAK